MENKNIEYLPSEIDILEDLFMLNLKDNDLTTLLNELMNIKHLIILILCNNKIKEIRVFIYEMKQLSTICLHGNGLLDIKEDIENNPNLENIDEDILKLPNLKEFCVDDRFLPFIVSNKNLFSKIKYINYKPNDDLLKQLDFEFVNNDWQEEDEDKYFGAICLSTNEIDDDSYDLEDTNE